MSKNKFLPINKQDMHERGWDKADFVVVSGDAYVDHPSFGAAVISRVLDANGFKVCIVAQPKNSEDYSVFGEPKYGFMVTSGNVDSMVAHYTSAKRRRSEDAYSPGGKAGIRPDRAVTFYSQKLRELFPSANIILGGLEASLRRFAHYDYWDDDVKPSILVESKADLLVFGMGENQTTEIANRLRDGENIDEIRDVLGTCYTVLTQEYVYAPCAECASFEIVKGNKEQYAKASLIQHEEQDDVRGRRIIQRHGKCILVQNPPMPPLTTKQFDAVYELPYVRDYHPVYERDGGISAIEEVKFSVIHNRGCFGDCNFCSLSFHQGRKIAVRSEESILREVKQLVKYPDFKGYIHDVGGPTANFRDVSCKKQLEKGLCKNKKCLAPTPCKSLEVSHEGYLNLLRKIRAVDGVKKVFVRSGIRFDYLMLDQDDRFFKELVTHHVSGQLKVAPEHCSSGVLSYMGKPDFSVYNKFKDRFYEITKSIGKKQYLVPYLMSSHPGSTMEDAVELSLYLKREKMRPEQVQDFYPTPGTLATTMYHTGINPLTMKPVFVAKTPDEKAKQRAMLQYFLPQNRKLVLSALKKISRYDLIGKGPNHLVAPFEDEGGKQQKKDFNHKKKYPKYSRKKKK